MFTVVKRVAAGLVLGAAMGLPPTGELLVRYGFWGSWMWIALIFGALGAWLFVRRSTGFALVQILVGTSVGFCATFVSRGMSPGEGYPATALLIGLWMSACVVATGSPLLLLFRTFSGRQPNQPLQPTSGGTIGVE
jgi:hypothetical protein